jgi:hypothetical protein
MDLPTNEHRSQNDEASVIIPVKFWFSRDSELAIPAEACVFYLAEKEKRKFQEEFSQSNSKKKKHSITMVKP